MSTDPVTADMQGQKIMRLNANPAQAYDTASMPAYLQASAGIAATWNGQPVTALNFGILAESAMSYLGVGVQPPTATWASMLRDGQELMALAPRLVLVPGLVIALTSFGFNLVGEGLRDALDPKD